MGRVGKREPEGRAYRGDKSIGQEEPSEVIVADAIDQNTK
jgi:hypothetical protein